MTNRIFGRDIIILNICLIQRKKLKTFNINEKLPKSIIKIEKLINSSNKVSIPLGPNVMADDIKMIALWQIWRAAELYSGSKYYPRKHTSRESELVRALKIKSTQ